MSAILLWQKFSNHKRGSNRSFRKKIGHFTGAKIIISEKRGRAITDRILIIMAIFLGAKFLLSERGANSHIRKRGAIEIIK